MRCFTFDDGKIVPGIRFQSIEGIKIAEQTVGFDQSLIFNPASHFGQYIINASTEKRGNALFLTEANVPSDDVLVHIFVRISKGSEVTFRRQDHGWIKHIGGFHGRVTYTRAERYESHTFEGLIQLSKGGEFMLVEETQQKLTRVQAFVGLQPPDPITRKVSLCYDGERFSYPVFEPEGTRPIAKHASFNMYEGYETLRMITELSAQPPRLD